MFKKEFKFSILLCCMKLIATSKEGKENYDRLIETLPMQPGWFSGWDWRSIVGGKAGVYIIGHIPYQVQDLVIREPTELRLDFYSEKEKEVAKSVLERSPLAKYLEFV